MSFAFQFLDVAVVLIILASAVYATYRGFVSESLAIFGWIAAAYATLYFGPWVAWWMRGMMNPPWLGEAVGYLLVFLVVLIPLQFASSRISQNIKKSQVGTVDSVLGTGFGILRGVAIVGIAYLVFTAWVPSREQPGWIVNARLYPAIRASAEVVASLIPDQKVRGPKEIRETQDPIVEKLKETSPVPPKSGAPRAAEPQRTPPPKAKPVKHAKKTYGAKDRHALDRLIETTNSDASGKQ
jgi:membrane protein required for colicin V production